MTQEVAPYLTAAVAALPLYVSHKKVRAAKILRIEPGSDDGALLHFSDGIATVAVSADYMRKHQPQAGGYFVVYMPDGYRSWSPASAFEEGYTLLPPVPTSINAGAPNPSASSPVTTGRGEG